MRDAKPKLTRVKMGVNKKTWAPIYYVEARMNPLSRWCLVTDGKTWLIHRSEVAANRAAAKLAKRLIEKMKAA